MTTASTYFQRGPNGEPPMFGPEGFAREETPTYTNMPLSHRGEHDFKWGEPYKLSLTESVDSTSALALCEKATQVWIRSKGYGYEVSRYGRIYIVKPDHEMTHGGFGDWHHAALWVYGQTKEKGQ